MIDIAKVKERGWKTAVYGYQLHEVVENILELYDEGGIRVDYGTRLRLVAFAPKVRVSSINSATNDGRAYFFSTPCGLTRRATTTGVSGPIFVRSER